MSVPSKFARVAVVLFSLTLLAGYVIYSHVTPNTPPPDPLGLNEVEAKQEPNAPDFDGLVKTDNATPSSKHSGNELRIISSKVINQPVFSVRHGPFRWKQPQQKKKELEIGFGRFGVEVNGKRGLGHASLSKTKVEEPQGRPSSLWQRLFGRKQASAATASGNNLPVISSKAIKQAATPAADLFRLNTDAAEPFSPPSEKPESSL